MKVQARTMLEQKQAGGKMQFTGLLDRAALPRKVLPSPTWVGEVKAEV